MVKVFETTSFFASFFKHAVFIYNITAFIFFFKKKLKVQGPSIIKSRFSLKMQDSRSFACRQLCALMWRATAMACVSLAARLLCFQMRSLRSESSSCEQSGRSVTPGCLCRSSLLQCGVAEV